MIVNKDLQLIINQAFSDAQSFGYEYLTVEQLLMALLKDKSVVKVLTALRLDYEGILDNLVVYIEQNSTYLPNQENVMTEPTTAFQRVIQRAAIEVESAQKDEITSLDVLIAILNEEESYACSILNQYNIDRLSVMNYISRNILSVTSASQEMKEETREMENTALTRYTLNLNQIAKQGRIDPLIGRAPDIDRVMQVLCRRRKNNPILVGEAGVGKTAIAEGLAWLIEQNRVPDILQDAVIYSFDMSSLIAGTTYRGDFEKRFNELVSELEKKQNSILFIDEIHMIIGAGATGESKIDTANLFKPLLSSGRMRIIGSTTYQEFSRIFEKDHALARRFQKIDVVEPSADDTYKILTGLKSHYEQYHQVHYTNKALHSAVELSVKYITERFLPDKAIDLIDEAGAKNALLPEHRRKKVINEHDIERVVARIARVPEKNVSDTDKNRLKQLPLDLKAKVFGQDKALDALCDAIKLNRAGLGRDHKPIGSFLFAGPTGVGKTEITVQLSEALNIALLRFDMSEYKEPHTVSRLIGSPPGYVGYETGGLLTDAIIKNPYAVLLLDEIEKAHPDIFNLLLQIMDSGTLTDSNGRKADFRNIILVMTTNAGAQETVKESMGFAEQDNSTNAMQEIARVFSPEFRNRLDNIIWFAHLTPEIIARIVDKFIDDLAFQLKEKHVSLMVSKAARAWLANKGYDKVMGARPMARVIDENIKKPVAHELLFGNLQQGGIVKVDIKKKQLMIEYKVPVS